MYYQLIQAIIAAITAIILVIQNWGAITEWFKGVWESITQTVTIVVQNISNFFMTAWNGIIIFFTTICETIKNILDLGLQFVIALIEGVFLLITLPFQLFWENGKETIMIVLESIKSIVKSGIQVVSNVVNSMMGFIQGIISSVWQAIRNTISTVLSIIQKYHFNHI